MREALEYMIATLVIGQDVQNGGGGAAAEPAGASTAQQAADQLAANAGSVQSVWDFVLKGGVMMIPIGIASFIMLAVVAERLITLRRRNIIPPAFIKELEKLMDSSGHDRTRALEYCKKNKSPIASVCSAGIRKIGRPVEAIERAVQEAGEWEVFKLRKNTRILSVIAAVAPLLGLVGTIFGMIKAFQTVSESAEALGKTELLATGIYEAMVTTAAGLLVAIPALIFYHWISAKIERLVAEMDRVCIRFIEEQLVDVEPSPVARLARSDSEDARSNSTGEASPKVVAS